MDKIAMWIGYAVMAAGGIGLAIGALWLAAEGFFRLCCTGLNMGDILDATAEWKQAHPEKFLRWKKRNGLKE